MTPEQMTEALVTHVRNSSQQKTSIATYTPDGKMMGMMIGMAIMGPLKDSAGNVSTFYTCGPMTPISGGQMVISPLVMMRFVPSDKPSKNTVMRLDNADLEISVLSQMPDGNGDAVSAVVVRLPTYATPTSAPKFVKLTELETLQLAEDGRSPQDDYRDLFGRMYPPAALGFKETLDKTMIEYTSGFDVAVNLIYDDYNDKKGDNTSVHEAPTNLTGRPVPGTDRDPKPPEGDGPLEMYPDGSPQAPQSTIGGTDGEIPGPSENAK